MINPLTGLNISSVSLRALSSVNNVVLSIPARFMSFGLHRFTLHVEIGSTGLFPSSLSTFISYSLSSIEPYIGPPAMQLISRGWDTTLILSPITYSYDPDISDRSAPQVGILSLLFTLTMSRPLGLQLCI